MDLPSEFSIWVKDPARTNDELFLAELLIEKGHDKWRDVTHAPWSRTYRDQLEAKRKQRALNPAYRPKLSPKKLAQTVEVWAQIQCVETDWQEQFPVRDLAALHFFPHLTAVKLRSELRDLSGLAVLRELRKLELDDGTLVDFGPLAKHLQLEELTLKLSWPWPDLSALSVLPQLKRLSFSGNVLVFADVERLSQVEKAEIGTRYSTTVPLREMACLPDMPRVRELKVEATASLRGVERYPLLEKLSLGGPFSDLTPLRSLSNLRELNLSGERFLDLAPLARLPRLLTLELDRERGLDLTPLSDSASLRQVKSRCKVLQTELATVNAALGFVDESEFLAPEPGPLPPLRYLSCRRKDADGDKEQPVAPLDERKAAFGDDPLMEPAEVRWFTRLVRQKLDAFGDAYWIRTMVIGHTVLVNLFRVQEAENLREMIEALRPLLHAARFRWGIFFSVDLDGDPEEDDWERPNYEVFDAEREREEWEEQQQYAKDRQEMLEREHQMRLQPKQEVTEKESPVSSDNEEEFGERVDAEPPGRKEDNDEDKELVDDRSFQLSLKGDIAWLHEEELEDSREFLYGIRVEDWHQLPEPPEQRPKWRGW